MDVKESKIFVSVMIPMRNEEHFIESCLQSIIENDYPQNLLEILVIDGMSTDRSRDIVSKFAERYPYIRLIENPKKITPAALNIGIREAKGKIIMRMDAHSTYASDFIRNCAILLQNTEAVNVGATIKSVGTGFVSEAIAIAMSSRFGVGNSAFRTSNKEMWVDTVFPGAWYKKTLTEFGGFNEDLIANQDAEFNYRLRKNGGKILLSPKLRCNYYVRSSLSGLARQFFRNGYWKLRTFKIYPESLRFRQIVPPFFVLCLFISLLMVPLSWPLATIIPVLYILVDLIMSIKSSREHGIKYLVLLPIIFPILHIAWGAGFWVGVFRFGMPRFSLATFFKFDQ